MRAQFYNLLLGAKIKDYLGGDLLDAPLIAVAANGNQCNATQCYNVLILTLVKNGKSILSESKTFLICTNLQVMTVTQTWKKTTGPTTKVWHYWLDSLPNMVQGVPPL